MDRIRSLRLLLVTDGSGDARRIERVAAEAFAGGLRAVQVREPGMSGRALDALVRALRKVVPSGEGTLLVNDRLDVALTAGADGVHLGIRSFGGSEARRLLGPGRIVGVSTHSADEAASAVREGADFVVFGPVFETPSKAGRLAPRGIEGLRTAVRVSAVPVLAIGGIGEAQARACAEAGAAGVACIRAIFEDPEPARAAARILAAYEGGGAKAG
jgi:thiamine-phosphate pyrophosphorylase